MGDMNGKSEISIEEIWPPFYFDDELLINEDGYDWFINFNML